MFLLCYLPESLQQPQPPHLWTLELSAEQLDELRVSTRTLEIVTMDVPREEDRSMDSSIKRVTNHLSMDVTKRLKRAWDIPF